MKGGSNWGWLAQQTAQNDPVARSQQFAQAAQGAGQAINQAGGAFTQAIKQKQIRKAGNDILGLMEQGQLNEQTMAGVLKNNRLGMQEAQEVIGLLQKSGAIAEAKARTANTKANTQATIGQEGRAGQKFGQEADTFNWQKTNRDEDRDLTNREAESRINVNNANASYAESGKAAGNKPVDTAKSVKDFVDNHPQIKNAMTPVKGTSSTKEQGAQPLSKEDAEYYQELAGSEGFELVLRPSQHTAGRFASWLPGGDSVGGATVIDGYTIESVRYVGNSGAGGGNSDPLGLGL